MAYRQTADEKVKNRNTYRTVGKRDRLHRRSDPRLFITDKNTLKHNRPRCYNASSMLSEKANGTERRTVLKSKLNISKRSAPVNFDSMKSSARFSLFQCISGFPIRNALNSARLLHSKSRHYLLRIKSLHRSVSIFLLHGFKKVGALFFR